MDFAKNLMKKYGWKEGDGLGKNTDGIEKPLKANLKFDNAGLGHDRATDFNNHWWERVYNDAANNLDVKNEDKVTVAAKCNDALEISTKEYSVNKLKKLTGTDSYNNFLKSSTLSETGESKNPDSIEIDEIKLPTFQSIADHELFAACGGRTAHKGARHGLNLTGKLARIEQQERELLSKLQNTSTTDSSTLSELWQSTSKKKKKRKRNHEDDVEEKQHQQQLQEHHHQEQENQDELAALLDNSEYVISKKKRKENRKRDKDLSSCLKAFSVDENKLNVVNYDTLFESSSSKETKKRKKKRKKKTKESLDDSDVDVKTSIVKETIDELDDQLTVNSLEVNISDSEQKTKIHGVKKTKSKKAKKRERRMISKLVDSLENTVVIKD